MYIVLFFIVYAINNYPSEYRQLPVTLVYDVSQYSYECTDCYQHALYTIKHSTGVMLYYCRDHMIWHGRMRFGIPRKNGDKISQ